MAEIVNTSFMLLTVLVLCYAYVAAQGFIFPGSTFHGCRTPDNKRGNCMSILECEPVTNYIQQLQNQASNAEIKKGLQPYICSQTETLPKVCCPPTSIPIPVKPQIPTVPTQERLKLLPMNDCGTTPNIDRIVNGMNASLYEFPWMAALMYRSTNGPEFQCGGTLINKRYVLTAAHCLIFANKLLQKELVQIRLGEHNFDTEEDCDENPFGKTCAPPVQDFDVSLQDAIIHPKFNPVTLSDDIALIRLRRDANLTAVSVKPVCLPIIKVSRRTAFKKNLTVSGWGTTENGTYSPFLLKVVVPAVDNDKCSGLYQGPILITQDQLCAGGKNSQNTCTGDSGGPLMQQVAIGGILRTVQYGVVSAGPALCEKKDFPVRYTRLTSYTDWILENIRP